MTDSPRDLLDPIVESFDGESDDWADVLKRAEAPRPWRRRFPRALVLAAALLVVGLAIAAPFGLAGKVIGLFREGGKPVPVASLSESDRSALILSMCSQVRLVTPAGKAPEERCADGDPRIEEIANNGTRLYWRATFPNGLECLASGRVRGYRETGGGRSHIGRMSCGRNGNLFPTPKRPITVDAAMTFSPRFRIQLLGAAGLAGDGVESVGLIETDGNVLKTSVEGRTYDFGRPPNRKWESIAAYDASGKEVYRESLHLDGRPPSRRSGPAKQPRAKPLPPLPKQDPVQHGEVPGATIDVYRSGLIAVHLDKNGGPYELLRPGKGYPSVGIGCSDVAYGAGHWATLGGGSYGTFGPEIQTAVGSVSPVQHRGEAPRPPFDLCTMRGRYGLRWNDARGMHGAVEVAFTPLGQRYFDEQAVATDLALFMRTPEMRAVRKGDGNGRVPTGARHRSALSLPGRGAGRANRLGRSGEYRNLDESQRPDRHLQASRGRSAPVRDASRRWRVRPEQPRRPETALLLAGRDLGGAVDHAVEPRDDVEHAHLGAEGDVLLEAGRAVRSREEALRARPARRARSRPRPSRSRSPRRRGAGRSGRRSTRRRARTCPGTPRTSAARPPHAHVRPRRPRPGSAGSRGAPPGSGPRPRGSCASRSSSRRSPSWRAARRRTPAARPRRRTPRSCERPARRRAAPRPASPERERLLDLGAAVDALVPRGQRLRDRRGGPKHVHDDPQGAGLRLRGRKSDVDAHPPTTLPPWPKL